MPIDRKHQVGSLSGPFQCSVTCFTPQPLPTPHPTSIVFLSSLLLLFPPVLPLTAHSSTALAMTRGLCSCPRLLQLPVAFISAHHPLDACERLCRVQASSVYLLASAAASCQLPGGAWRFPFFPYFVDGSSIHLEVWVHLHQPLLPNRTTRLLYTDSGSGRASRCSV